MYIIQVNVSELGLVTPAGKVVWGKYIYFFVLSLLAEFSTEKSDIDTRVFICYVCR